MILKRFRENFSIRFFSFCEISKYEKHKYVSNCSDITYNKQTTIGLIECLCVCLQVCVCVCVRCKASTIAMAHDVDSSFKIRLKRNPTESQSAFVYETQECVCLYVCVGVLVCVCVCGVCYLWNPVTMSHWSQQAAVFCWAMQTAAEFLHCATLKSS